MNTYATFRVYLHLRGFAHFPLFSVKIITAYGKPLRCRLLLMWIPLAMVPIYSHIRGLTISPCLMWTIRTAYESFAVGLSDPWDWHDYAVKIWTAYGKPLRCRLPLMWIPLAMVPIYSHIRGVTISPCSVWTIRTAYGSLGLTWLCCKNQNCIWKTFEV